MPPFRDEHILMIAPGSQTTLAQLGVPESYTPARFRCLTRMFKAEKPGEWEPVKVREKKRIMVASETNGTATGAVNGLLAEGAEAEEDTDEPLYEEDPTSDEGAVYPIRDGKIVNWSCLFALLIHIHTTISPPLHTPILLVIEPAWTQRDRESLTQFMFEKFRTPALVMMDSAMAILYAFGLSTATIVDVGFGKCDITAINDFVPCEVGRAIALKGCGGDGMTRKLLALLESKGFDKEMCEQLKRSNICEVLPLGMEMPSEVEKPAVEPVLVNPAAVASTGVVEADAGHAASVPGQTGLPQGPGAGTELGEDGEVKDAEDNEGVLDVASIVASGKTTEFLAKKEREKAEKAAAKKAAAADSAAAPKPTRLSNAQKVKAIFHYDQRRTIDDASEAEVQAVDEPMPDADQAPPTEGAAAPEEEPTVTRKEEKRKTKGGETFVRKEIEVGLERFQAADEVIDHIAGAIHHCILSEPEVHKRSEMWDSIVIVGNGSRLKGFKEALLATLTARYLISPSTATIFTSELPSSFSTPLATGANTPLAHHGSGVNPLLLAATTASNPHLAPPSQLQFQAMPPQHAASHLSHRQTPTSIKQARLPDYFPEWKEAGIEEAMFLGAQVAAKVLFVADQGSNKGFMTRSEYNDDGPQRIHDYVMG